MSSTKPKEKFDWRHFLPALFSIAIPIALQSLLTTTASMVDTMMIAPLGELTVGAIGLCAQFSALMVSCYYGFIGGGGLFLTQYWGAKDDRGIDRAYGATTVCLMTVAVIFAALAIFAPRFVMSIYTDKVSIQDIGVKYLKIVGWAYLMQVLSMAMSTLLRSTERVRIPLIASICSVAANIFLNWVFIYGHLGFHAMGVQGAALATTCAAFVNAAVILVAGAATRYVYLFHFKYYFRWTLAFFKEYMIKCFPVICNELLIGVGNMVINIVLGRQSEQVISALAVFRTLEGLVIGFFVGFSTAASVLVGKCVGAGELELGYQRAKRLVYLCQGVVLLAVLAIFSLHTPILHAMSLHGESFKACTNILIVYGIAAVIRYGNWMQNDTFRSAGETVYGTVLEISFMWIMLVPCVCAAGLWLHLPYWQIMICCYIDEPIRYILMQKRMYNGKWVKPVTDLGRAELPAFRQRRQKRKTA